MCRGLLFGDAALYGAVCSHVLRKYGRVSSRVGERVVMYTRMSLVCERGACAHDFAHNPAITQMFFGDGYSCEKVEIEKYVNDKLGSEPLTHKTRVPSPKTNEMVQPVMIPNHYLRQAIESWLAHKKKQKTAKEAGANMMK